MTLETEAVLDRRRLKRRLSFWRVLAVVAGIVALAGIGFSAAGDSDFGKKDQIARVSLTGVITEDRKQLKMLRKIAKDKKVKALLLYVNSPGGTTTGGEAIYEALREVAKKKPVVAQFGTVAASAAYIAGLGTDHIVARGNSITGSIGVIFQWAEVSELLTKVGVKFNEIKSGNMKAEPSPFKPITPEGRKVAEEMVADSKKWFLSLVKERRKIDTASIDGLEQGRIFSGREALRLKLVDEIGGERQAIKWLETKANPKVEEGLKVRDWRPKKEGALGWTSLSMAALAKLFGVDAWDWRGLLRQAQQSGAIPLDGLVSVWHPGKK